LINWASEELPVFTDLHIHLLPVWYANQIWNFNWKRLVGGPIITLEVHVVYGNKPF